MKQVKCISNNSDGLILLALTIGKIYEVEEDCGNVYKITKSDMPGTGFFSKNLFVDIEHELSEQCFEEIASLTNNWFNTSTEESEEYYIKLQSILNNYIK